MIHLLILAVHLLATIAKLMRPGGVRAVVAESALLKHQLIIGSRARRRAPNLNSVDRFVFGLGSLFVPTSRLPKLTVILKPRTLLKFHEALKRRKYRWLFSSGSYRRPGPKGPSQELINAIVEFKHRNPRMGCPRIAQEIVRIFGIDIDKDVVRRVLAQHYRPGAGTDGPSWLSFIGHMKDSLWSVDLFRCESILLHSHWVMVVMDVFTRSVGITADMNRDKMGGKHGQGNKRNNRNPIGIKCFCSRGLFSTCVSRGGAAARGASILWTSWGRSQQVARTILL